MQKTQCYACESVSLEVSPKFSIVKLKKKKKSPPLLQLTVKAFALFCHNGTRFFFPSVFFCSLGTQALRVAALDLMAVVIQMSTEPAGEARLFNVASH